MPGRVILLWSRIALARKNLGKPIARRHGVASVLSLLAQFSCQQCAVFVSTEIINLFHGLAGIELLTCLNVRRTMTVVSSLSDMSSARILRTATQVSFSLAQKQREQGRKSRNAIPPIPGMFQYDRSTAPPGYAPTKLLTSFVFEKVSSLLITYQSAEL